MRQQQTSSLKVTASTGNHKNTNKLLNHWHVNVKRQLTVIIYHHILLYQ